MFALNLDTFKFWFVLPFLVGSLLGLLSCYCNGSTKKALESASAILTCGPIALFIGAIVISALIY